jgi:hypothetical protein
MQIQGIVVSSSSPGIRFGEPFHHDLDAPVGREDGIENMLDLSVNQDKRVAFQQRYSLAPGR